PRRARPGRCAACAVLLPGERGPRRAARHTVARPGHPRGREERGLDGTRARRRVRDDGTGGPARDTAQAGRRARHAHHSHEGGGRDHTMRLTRLELSGFKSFAGAVELPFDTGVTAIVGPTGCGKSNISAAVGWVLGGRSPGLLRGGKMEDVIFQASPGRRPAIAAEVRPAFDN